MTRRLGGPTRAASVLGIVGVLGLLTAMAGCTWLFPDPVPTGDVAASSLSRDSDPSVSGDDLTTLVAGNSAFAFDLLHELTADAENLFYSPFSVSAALAMLYAGAEVDTEQQMADALHFDLGHDALHAGFNRLDLDLNARGTIELPYEGEGFELNVVNAAWGQRGYSFLGDYLDVLAVNYGAGLRLLEFADDPEGSRETINDWVGEQTNDRIVDLLPPGSIGPLTRLVLTNAVYFNAPWLKKFDPAQTTPGAFHLLDGSTATVPMMRQQSTFAYANWDGGKAVELPYNGNTLSMVVLVPDRGSFDAFESELDAARFEGIVSSFDDRWVHLQLPAFEAACDLSLVEPLTALGMTDAFDATADFSGIDGTHELFVSDVLHKAWVSVDETGTEAAAATAVIVVGGGVSTPATLTIDRPFLFVIRDIPTGTILFVGRVLDPA